MREDRFAPINRIENGGDDSGDDLDIAEHQMRLLEPTKDDTDGM